MKTAISIPDALFDSAERLAERLGVSRSEVYQRALARFLQDHADDSITESLNEVYSEAHDDDRLEPVFEALQSASLDSGEEW